MNRKAIAERLIALRGKRTQQEVADTIGITQTAYSQYECGNRIPRDDIKIRIAEYYKRSVKTIFYAD